MEDPGEYNFWPTASLITAGGRLLLALAEKLIAQAGGCHAMMDTDSIVVAASRTGGLIPCENGPERMPDGSLAIKALTWEQADQALNRFDSLSPYDPKLVPHLFKKEDESFAADGKTQMELRYFGISSKNYVLFRGTPQNPEIIKPSQHGLGTPRRH
jgi:hypothetical protein